MAIVTEIGISRRPEIRGGRPCIAGTGVSVMRIVGWSQTGLSPEQISQNYGHISPEQVSTALAYYQANREEIDADLAAEDQLAEELAKVYPRFRAD
jgi:uncharacterized protein (DUF433 family)